MRVVKSFADCNIVFRELLDFKNKLETKATDNHGLQIKNVGAGTDPSDVATVSQLTKIAATASTDEPVYTQVWQSTGPVNTGDKINVFVAGLNRDGVPNQVWLVARVAAGSLSLKVNFTVDGTTLLANPVELPIGQIDVPVFSSDFVSVVPKIKIQSAVIPIIVQGDGIVDIVSIGLVVKRTNQ